MASIRNNLNRFEIVIFFTYGMLFWACDSDSLLQGLLQGEAEEIAKKNQKKPSPNAPKQIQIAPGKLSAKEIKHLGLKSPAELGQANGAWFLENEAGNVHCQSSRGCQQSGRCAQVTLRNLRQPSTNNTIDFKCLAVDRKSCLSSQECLKRGDCTPKKGRCQVESNLDCFQSQRCRNYGLCNVEQGVCIAKNDQDCQNSLACQDFGACSYKVGLCVNKEDTLKTCAYGCVRSNQDCFCHPDPPEIKLPKSVEPACLTQCRQQGKCALSEQGCNPRNQKDCESSELCKSEGQCEYKNGRCVKSSAGCARSLQCTLVGQCVLYNQQCVASSVEDCLSSRACAEKEACQFQAHQQASTSSSLSANNQSNKDQLLEQSPKSETIQVGDCVRTARVKSCEQECVRFGQCELINDRCLATSRLKCRQSDNCIKYGRCTPKNGRCSAVSAVDCKRGLNCKRFGYCRPSQGSCIK